MINDPTPPSTETVRNVRIKSKPRLTRSKVNTMLALCAMAISAASFYATYLQAKASQQQVAAAERQLKAETWPWLKMGYSNFDINEEQQTINMNIQNSGTGPAIVHYIEYIYEGNHHYDILELLNDCCNLDAYQQALLDIEHHNSDINYRNAFGWLVSSTTNNILLANGEQYHVFTMQKTNFNTGLWLQIDHKIRKVVAKACYCSVLKECYTVDQTSHIEEVSHCSLPSLSKNMSTHGTQKL
ncbi:hypothetical protein J8L98_18790 [Pseudoalteromonas sp. MMG013]|nr:hypothetical protein [Pseudoalteromonas sp. MMG013]MBQ4863733.1 hypothetical protein [Pseudoalteromonas sp. MMG013]